MTELEKLRHAMENPGVLVGINWSKLLGELTVEERARLLSMPPQFGGGYTLPESAHKELLKLLTDNGTVVRK